MTENIEKPSGKGIKNLLRTSKKTIYLIMILAFLFFTINAILPYLFPQSNIGFEAEYNGETLKISNIILSEKKGKLKSELESIENLLLQEFVKENKELRDSLTNIAVQRIKDINNITDYINQLKIYKTLDSKKQQKLLIDIAIFLTDNPNIELDLGIISQDLAFQKMTQELDSTKKLHGNLFSENQKLIDEIDALKIDTAILKKDKKKIENLYIETVGLLETFEEIIDGLKKDTANLKEVIAFFTKNKDKLKNRVTKLEEDLKEVYSVRVDGLIFKPINTKARKDGSYKLNNIKNGFDISFKLIYNKPTSLKYDTVLIVYKVPNKMGVIIERKQYKRIKIGSDATFTFDDIQSYGKGQYIIQIIHEKTSKNIPVDKSEFVAH